PAAEWARSVPRPIVALVCSFVLSFWVAIADYQLAASAKAAAQEFAKQRDTMPEKVYFLGHWGYQYYMQEAGAIPFEDKLTEHNEALYAPLERGDMLVLPSISYAWAPDPRQNPLKRQIVISMDAHMSTMNHRAGAGFYSHVWGRLPFVIGQAPPEIFYFYEIGTGAGETAAREVLPGPEEKQ
ncbi:MAG: hypothetical protein QGG73_11965, partial [Candidatus Hydrogenedentes bacterium]|nr:hypothetical protein [Candidatus Hydrogenedentota bacterium]